MTSTWKTDSEVKLGRRIETAGYIKDFEFRSIGVEVKDIKDDVFIQLNLGNKKERERRNEGIASGIRLLLI